LALISVIEIKSSSDALLIMVMGEDDVKTYKLTSFDPKENETEMTFMDIKGKEKPFSVKSAVFIGSLLITDKSDSEDKLWYIRSEYLEKYKEIANEVIGSRR